MASSIFRVVRIALSVFLLTRAYFQYSLDPDWWIYVPVYALGAALCLFPFPSSGLWRSLSALVIVLGGLHVLFTVWSLHHVSKAVVSEPFVEGRNIALTAAAVGMTASVRLSTSAYRNVLAYARTVILLAAVALSVPAVIYSSCFYAPALPFCSLTR